MGRRLQNHGYRKRNRDNVSRRTSMKAELLSNNSSRFKMLSACGAQITSMYIGFKMFFYVVRHLDSIASHLPTGLHFGFRGFV